MIAAAPWIRVLATCDKNSHVENSNESTALPDRQGHGCECEKSKGYFLVDFIDAIVDLISSASRVAFSADLFKTSSFSIINKSTPLTSCLEMGVPVSLLIFSKRLYFSSGICTLVLIIFGFLGMLSPTGWLLFDSITLSPHFMFSLIIYYSFFTYKLYYFFKSKIYILQVSKFTLIKVNGGI